MKPLLGKVIAEAVRMAVADCIPAGARETFDEEALAQEVALRLLGPGGWMIGDAYAGNATVREVFEESFERPDRSIVSEVAFDLMCDMEDAHRLRHVDPGESDEGRDGPLYKPGSHAAAARAALDQKRKDSDGP